MQEISQMLDMLEKIYLIREQDMENESNNDRKVLKEKLNGTRIEEIKELIINKIENIENIKDRKLKKENDAEIKENYVITEESNEVKEIINKLELLIENYELQIAYYSEKNYKQGFKDAICLYTQCIR